MEAFGVALECKDQVGKGDTGVTPHIQEEHGVGTEGFHDTDKQVRLAVDAEVDEMVLGWTAWWEAEEVEFFFLHDK